MVDLPQWCLGTKDTQRSDVAGHCRVSALSKEQGDLRIQKRQRNHQLMKERVIQGGRSEKEEGKLAEEATDILDRALR